MGVTLDFADARSSNYSGSLGRRSFITVQLPDATLPPTENIVAGVSVQVRQQE